MKKIVIISIILQFQFSSQATSNKIILQTDESQTTYNLWSGWREICVLEKSSCHNGLNDNSNYTLKCEKTFLFWLTAINYLMAMVWGISLVALFDRAIKSIYLYKIFFLLLAMIPPYYFVRLYKTLDFENVQSNFLVSLLIFLIIAILTMLIVKNRRYSRKNL